MSLGYTPETDIPDLSGKTFLVTGGTSGIGKETIIFLSKHNPKHIYFTGRNTQAAESVIAAIRDSNSRLTFIPCDQTSLSSVQKAAKEFLQKSNNELDVLICNAGIMAVPPSVSKDGYEIQFAVNHLAHALLIKLCLPALQKTAEQKGDARIVSVSSLAFKSPPSEGIRFKDLKSDGKSLGFAAKWSLYGQSKLANVLYASQLAKRHPEITSIAVHPGVIPTGLADHMGWLESAILNVAILAYKKVTLQEGSYNTLWAATTNKNGLKSGDVYQPVAKPVEPTKLSADEGLAAKLWEWTQKEIEAY